MTRADIDNAAATFQSILNGIEIDHELTDAQMAPAYRSLEVWRHNTVLAARKTKAALCDCPIAESFGAMQHMPNCARRVAFLASQRPARTRPVSRFVVAFVGLDGESNNKVFETTSLDAARSMAERYIVEHAHGWQIADVVATTG